jgi:DNA helicase HerA-like ATPase
MSVHIGSDQGGRKIGLSTKTFTTHTTVVGMTGSGKTGLVLGIAEEFIKNKIPVILLDIKGDMANIFLQPEGELKEAICPRLITPGAVHGEPIDVAAGLKDKDRVSETITSILNLLDVPSDPIKSKYHTTMVLLPW